MNSTKDMNGGEAIVMSLDEYLGYKGLSSPISDYNLDKWKIPHGETIRQQAKRTKEAEDAIIDYSTRRNEAIKEYKELLLKGILKEPTITEQLIKKAAGHADNESVIAARRALDKRGIDWRSVLNQSEEKEELELDM